MQIIRYLYKNGAEPSKNIWKFAVHSNNPELIKFLEDNKIQTNKMIDSMAESIKCYHTEMAYYINDNLLEEKDGKIDDNLIIEQGMQFHNYLFLNDIYKNSFFDLCKYGYYNIVNLLLQNSDVDINHQLNINKDSMNNKYLITTYIFF